MSKFIGEDFMLENDAARELYHEHAARMPIIDYHCHLVPQMIAENRRFREHYRGVARRRPLQMACNAGQRRRRGLYYR